MSRRRYRPPAGDGEVLIDPPLESIVSLIRPPLGQGLFERIGTPSFRSQARQEVLKIIGAPADRPLWFVAGHQPEFFHPGVWFKNFVLSRLAHKLQAIGLNIIVDNDVPKSAAVRVPVWKPNIDVRAITTPSVPFAEMPPKNVPFEEWSCRDRELGDSFPARLNEATQAWPFRPIGVESSHESNHGDWMVCARQSWEETWGAKNYQIRVSQLSQTNAFRQFVDQFLDHAPVVRTTYNSVIGELRGKRNRLYPIPDLSKDQEWIESPFWCWSMTEPRRHRLFVRRDGTSLRLRWGPNETTWPDGSIKIRPRALTLTLFARLALADVFIHGIGGAVYEDVNDRFIKSATGERPSPYVVVSGTLRLPFPLYLSTPADLEQARRRERDLMWNPHRMFDAPILKAEREQLLAMPRETRSQRRERTRLLRLNLERWQPLVADELQAARQKRQQIEAELKANAILSSREYPWVLYPEEKLRAFLSQ